MSNPLRVLSIAHTAVSSQAGRLRYYPLADDPSVETKLVFPKRWHQFGRWYEADPPDPVGLAMHALPVRLPRAGPASWYLHYYAGLRAVVRRFAPDVIHLWEEPWSVVALQGCYLARQCGAALVLEVDQNLMKTLPPPFEQIRRYVLRHTTLILSRSSDATAVVRANGYCGPALPIAYGVDHAKFRNRVGAPPRPPLKVGYVGRLVQEKGLDDVLDAMAAARAPVQLAIMGEGPHEPALRDRIAQLGLAERVSFQPWGEPGEVAGFMHQQHAILLTTRTDHVAKEQFGRVIIEAQACGVPVIGSTSGSIPDVVGAGGWIVPERDPADTREACWTRSPAIPTRSPHADARARPTSRLASPTKPSRATSRNPGTKLRCCGRRTLRQPSPAALHGAVALLGRSAPRTDMGDHVEKAYAAAQDSTEVLRRARWRTLAELQVWFRIAELSIFLSCGFVATAVLPWSAVGLSLGTGIITTVVASMVAFEVLRLSKPGPPALGAPAPRSGAVIADVGVATAAATACLTLQQTPIEAMLSWDLCFAVTAGLSLLLLRTGFAELLRRMLEGGRLAMHVAVFGDGPVAQRTLARLQSANPRLVAVLGRYSDARETAPAQERARGNVAHLARRSAGCKSSMRSFWRWSPASKANSCGCVDCCVDARRTSTWRRNSRKTPGRARGRPR